MALYLGIFFSLLLIFIIGIIFQKRIFEITLPIISVALSIYLFWLYPKNFSFINFLLVVILLIFCFAIVGRAIYGTKHTKKDR
jgi:Ca2+/Na+ antiporter|uniref:Membrane protein n=1 Tax=Lactococcus lactis TaxID=1358 RepID=L0N615_9LACT|nr:membrane protein [Lactococcus lactis]